jgi:phosphohistidine phosphatase
MMLYFVRHGLAEDRADPASPPDPERSLTPKGMEKTRAVMRGLRELGVEPDAIVTSPYLRAAQTAELACEVLGFAREKVRRSDALKPSGDPAVFFRELGKVRGKEVLCCGHAPQLDLAISFAIGMDVPVTALKKAGVACLEIEKLSPVRAEIQWILTPRMLRKLGK